MSTSVEIARPEDVAEIIDVMVSVGLNPSRGKLEGYFFDVPVSEAQSPVRGGLVVRDAGKIVGYCGLSPCRIWMAGKSFDGYQMGILGLQPGYGADMFALIDAVQDISRGRFVVANTANAKSVKLWTTYGGCTSGPDMGACIQYDLLPSALLTLPRVVPGDRQVRDFTDSRFEVFWEEYRTQTKGAFLSREPARLQRIFGAGLRARRLVLLVVHARECIVGYAVLRVKPFSRTPYRRFEVIDLAVLGSSPVLLETLLKKCRWYARLHGGVMLEYVGGSAGLQQLLARYLPRRRAALANTAFWMTDVPELAAVFKANAGWLFGPYDGDRCA